MAENMKEMFKESLGESLESLKDDLTSSWEPHFNEVKALSHENAAKSVLLRSELNSMVSKVTECHKQIDLLRAGLEGQGAIISKLQKRAPPADVEEINIEDLGGTPATNPKAKKSKKKQATPATSPVGARSPRLQAKASQAQGAGSK